ncbi:MAG TPA: hypothetical protein VG389_10070 [Myxococcota bacterium]|nr:hypothetical protein [Myxococcota bacterium]
MSQGKVSAVIAPADLQSIQEAIATLREKLPFRVALSTAERKRLTKVGPKSVAFVTNALGLATGHPELVPAAVDVPELEKDVRLFESLGPIASELVALAQAVVDTRTVAGSEAMSVALVLYGVFQAAERTVPEVASFADELGVRFRKRASNATEPPPASSGENG